MAAVIINAMIYKAFPERRHMKDILNLLENIRGLDKTAVLLAEERQRNLYKPMGSLGVLEDISVRLAGITGRIKNSVDRKALFLFGADNGIYEEGVSGSPRELTRILMENYADDKNCGINVICRNYGVDLRIVNMGVSGCRGRPGMDDRALMPEGTYNFARRPAMDADIAVKAVNIGADYAFFAKDSGYDIIGGGEVGMGNTTTAAACVMAACGFMDADIAVGRGGGLSDEAFDKKKKVISEALARYSLKKDDPLGILCAVGGLDIAAMTGLYLGAAYCRLPIVMDGLISAAAALLAYRFSSLSADFMIPSHISAEPAYSVAVKELGLKPFLALDMRLGEGSGCPIAMGVMETACAVMNEMATFEEMKVGQEYRKNIKMK